MTMSSIAIGIAGAGIGGLAAAVALSKEGHEVEVYEAASALTQIGAGIQLAPNATKVLLAWGVDKYLTDLSDKYSCFKVHRWSDGETIGEMYTRDHKERFGGPYVQVHRADLQMALLHVAEDNGVIVHTKSRIVDYDLDEPAMFLSDGRKIVKDLLIAADGIKSIARQKISQTMEEPTLPTGLAVFRATLDATILSEDPELAFIVDDPGLNIWIGPHRHAVTYAMQGGHLVNIVLEHPDPRDPSEWNAAEFLDEIRSLFKDWDPRLLKLLSMIESPSKWPLRFSVPLENWSSQSGRVLLVGDAAHTVPSFLAQGAAMAIEDAGTLATMLRTVQSVEQISTIIKPFQDIRLQRKMKVQEMSLQNLNLYHLSDGDDQVERDNPNSTRRDLAPIWNSKEDQTWLYGHWAYSRDTAIQVCD